MDYSYYKRINNRVPFRSRVVEAEDDGHPDDGGGAPDQDEIDVDPLPALGHLGLRVLHCVGHGLVPGRD